MNDEVNVYSFNDECYVYLNDYKQLQQKVQQLEWDIESITNYYNDAKELYFKARDKVNQLETNRDELKKWLEEFQEDYCYDTDVEYFCIDENVEIKVQDVLDKMQELERGKECSK